MGKSERKEFDFTLACKCQLLLFRRKLERLEELENEADLVVNCCGLGAADLVSSSKTFVARNIINHFQLLWILFCNYCQFRTSMSECKSR